MCHKTLRQTAIKMSIQCRSLNMRHVSRALRVDCRVKLDLAISIRYANTKVQLADILTGVSFTMSQWE